MPEPSRSARDTLAEETWRRILTPQDPTCACPFCGHEVWSTGEDFVKLTFTGDTPLEGRSGWNFDALPFACENCGFIRLHAAQILGKSN
jgi:hypothetical protein